MVEREWQLPPEPTALVKDAMHSREERTRAFIATRDQILQRIQTLLEEHGQINGRRKIWRDNITLGSLEADVWITIESKLNRHGEHKGRYTVTMENYGRPPWFFEESPPSVPPFRRFYRQLIIKRRGPVYRALGQECCIQEKARSLEAPVFTTEEPVTIQDNIRLNPWRDLLEYIEQRQKAIIHVPEVLKRHVPCMDPLRTF